MIVTYNQLRDELKRVLLKYNFGEGKADLCAGIFASNSRDGVHSHGLHRFPTFIKYIKEGFIDPGAEPEVIGQIGIVERWNGNLGPGMYTASLAMDRCIKIATEHGIGCVSVNNTNHWMRGGTYAWQAAEQNCISICSTNAIANMPPYGGETPTLGNNPLVIGVPGKSGHVVLDMAISQFSYGKLNEYKMKDARLPVPGGYDKNGKLSTDAREIIDSQRTLPVGFWKGSGLSMMMDLLVSCLSNGKTVRQVTDSGAEYGVSQFFICFSPLFMNERLVEEITDYARSSHPAEGFSSVKYPGEDTLKRRSKSMTEGIQVNEDIWKEVTRL